MKQKKHTRHTQYIIAELKDEFLVDGTFKDWIETAQWFAYAGVLLSVGLYLFVYYCI